MTAIDAPYQRGAHYRHNGSPNASNDPDILLLGNAPPGPFFGVSADARVAKNLG